VVTTPTPVAVVEPTPAQRDYTLVHQGYSPRNVLRVSGKAPNKP
jgi:hypothetical protein